MPTTSDWACAPWLQHHFWTPSILFSSFTLHQKFFNGLKQWRILQLVLTMKSYKTQEIRRNFFPSAKIPLTTMPSSCAKTSSSMAQQGNSIKVKMSQQSKVILKIGYHVVRCKLSGIHERSLSSTWFLFCFSSFSMNLKTEGTNFPQTWGMNIYDLSLNCLLWNPLEFSDPSENIMTEK